jgi:methylmalonyl-CoA mutase
MSRNRVPKLAVPGVKDWGEILPSSAPRIFRVRSRTPAACIVPPEAEDPIRISLARRPTKSPLHLLARGHAATRLSTALIRPRCMGKILTPPDIYGRRQFRGLVATLDDMEEALLGLICANHNVGVDDDQRTGADDPGMFANTAIDQRGSDSRAGRWSAAQFGSMSCRRVARARPAAAGYRGELPPGHDGTGLALLGIAGEQLVAPGV